MKFYPIVEVSAGENLEHLLQLKKKEKNLTIEQTQNFQHDMLLKCVLMPMMKFGGV